MKPIVVLAALALAGPSSAATFGPASTSVTVQGPFVPQTPRGYETCHGVMKAVVGRAGGMKITAFSTGGIDPKCVLTATGLPYRVTATSRDTATIWGVAWSGALGRCGPLRVIVRMNGQGRWRFDQFAEPGSCALRGGGTPTPRVTIQR